jgi:sugar fermentation stimulation protein A
VIFDPPLEKGVLLRRYKRFFVDVQLDDGRTVVTHCTNTGRMSGCSEPGSEVLIAPAPPGTKRKLLWTLRLVRAGRSWVSVDTLMANRVVIDALRRGRIPELAGYDTVRPEAKVGDSRFDALLTDSAGKLPPCWVEVKNVTLRSGRLALFPDAVSTRGLKHLDGLAARAATGERAVLLPFVARGDCQAFDAAAHIDPDWAAGLHRAAAAGVEIRPWEAAIDKRSIRLGRPLEWTPRAGMVHATR